MIITKATIELRQDLLHRTHTELAAMRDQNNAFATELKSDRAELAMLKKQKSGAPNR